MESTKTVSLRVDRGYYDRILFESEQRGINTSEWIESKIAIAEKVKKSKKEILDRMESILASEKQDSIVNLIRIRKLIRFVQQEL